MEILKARPAELAFEESTIFLNYIPGETLYNKISENPRERLEKEKSKLTCSSWKLIEKEHVTDQVFTIEGVVDTPESNIQYLNINVQDILFNGQKSKLIKLRNVTNIVRQSV